MENTPTTRYYTDIMVEKVAMVVGFFLTAVLAFPGPGGLDEKAQTKGFRMGTTFLSEWGGDRQTAAVAAAQFGFLSPSAALDWDGSDDWQTWTANASAWKLPFRGPRLAGGKTPAKLNGLSSRELDTEFLARVGALKAVGTAGLLSWDAAANVFTGAGIPSDNAFSRVWGSDWPAHALALVRSIDPKTPLFLAEDDTLALNPRSDALYRLVTDLKARKVPLDGVALGSRQRQLYRADSVLVGANLKRFADLGLEIHLYGVEFGLEPGELLKGRGSASPQNQSYDSLFRWVLAIPAVKRVSLAGPSDQYALPWPSGWTPASPALYTADGTAKDLAVSIGQILTGPRPTVEELSGPATRVDALPLDGIEGTGLPRAWGGDVGDLVREGGAGAKEVQTRAVFYLNPPPGSKPPYTQDLSLLWSLSWIGQKVVFLADRIDDQVLLGNRGESFFVEVRGPGFAAVWRALVGEDGADTGVSGAWSAGGRRVRVVFDVPADAGWGPGTTFFVRFSTTDTDDGNDQGLTLYPWPGTKDKLPFERVQIVKGRP